MARRAQTAGRASGASAKHPAADTTEHKRRSHHTGRGRQQCKQTRVPACWPRPRAFRPPGSAPVCRQTRSGERNRWQGLIIHRARHARKTARSHRLKHAHKRRRTLMKASQPQHEGPRQTEAGDSTHCLTSCRCVMYLLLLWYRRPVSVSSFSSSSSASRRDSVCA